MPGTSNRLRKISDLLKREVALLIQTEIRDPRVGMASVTSVKVSRDLAHAEVFLTLMGKSTTAEAEEGIAALNKAAGYLRNLLAKNINLRTTPKLKFTYDDSVIKGQYLSSLIDDALAQDRSAHAKDDSSEPE